MARPERNTVDYFPHICGNGKKLFYIESTYGNDGYATWYKILEKLATTDYHFLNLNNEEEILYLSAICKVDENKLLSIINDLSRIGAFNKVAWQKKIVWSDLFIDSIQDAYTRRNNKCINFEGLCKHLSSLGIHLIHKCKLKDDEKPQTILEDTIKEETINIEFNVFWDLYNKKKGDKEKIEKKWNKLKNDERQKIIDTLPNFLNSIKDKQFLPYPETYINKKRWNDEIEINSEPNKKHYYLSSPFGKWDGLLTEEEFINKTKSGHWTLIKTA